MFCFQGTLLGHRFDWFLFAKFTDKPSKRSKPKLKIGPHLESSFKNRSWTLIVHRLDALCGFHALFVSELSLAPWKGVGSKCKAKPYPGAWVSLQTPSKKGPYIRKRQFEVGAFVKSQREAMFFPRSDTPKR